MTDSETDQKCPGCGQRKHLWGHADAVRVAAYQVCRKRTISFLRIYPCKGGRGWHLTKKPLVLGGTHHQQREPEENRS